MSSLQSRRSQDRAQGHDYAWDALARCHICKGCGTAKHTTCWWFAGQKFDYEPSCLQARTGKLIPASATGNN